MGADFKRVQNDCIKGTEKAKVDRRRAFRLFEEYDEGYGSKSVTSQKRIRNVTGAHTIFFGALSKLRIGRSVTFGPVVTQHCARGKTEMNPHARVINCLRIAYVSSV